MVCAVENDKQFLRHVVLTCKCNSTAFSCPVALVAPAPIAANISALVLAFCRSIVASAGLSVSLALLVRDPRAAVAFLRRYGGGVYTLSAETVQPSDFNSASAASWFCLIFSHCDTCTKQYLIPLQFYFFKQIIHCKYAYRSWEGRDIPFPQTGTVRILPVL